jgi:hypothetical protein
VNIELQATKKVVARKRPPSTGPRTASKSEKHDKTNPGETAPNPYRSQ